MPRKPIRILLTVLVAIVCVSIVLWIAGYWLASRKVAEVKHVWAETLGTRDEILARFPAREANEAALELERLTANLGIDIATRTAEGRMRPSEEAIEKHKQVKSYVGNYYVGQIEQPQRATLPPPEQLTDFLEAERANLMAIRRHLRASDLLRWEMSLEEPFHAPLPNLLGHIDLQKLMVAEAMVRNGRAQNSEALEILEASWKLNSAIWDDPNLITQLIAIAVTRLQAGALRQIDEVPEEWRERLREHDFRSSHFTAMLLESRDWLEIADTRTPDYQAELVEKLARPFAKPYASYCFADISDDYRRRLSELIDSGASCDYYGVGRNGALDLPVLFGNVFGTLAKVGLMGALDRLARLELDLELTDKILAQEHAPWDDRTEPSSACSRDNWIYATAPDGSRSIGLSRDVSWPEQLGAILPTSLRLGSATSPARAPR